MSASQRYIPFLIAGGAGILGGLYIWEKPFQELSGAGAPKGPIKDGRSQAAQDGQNKDSSPSTTSDTLTYGGVSANDRSAPTVAGTSASSRKSGSVDHGVQTRTDGKSHDGTGGGGVGVAEMRERKMDGKGLPSPQGGDTSAQPVPSAQKDGVAGEKKSGNTSWWSGKKT